MRFFGLITITNVESSSQITGTTVPITCILAPVCIRYLFSFLARQPTRHIGQLCLLLPLILIVSSVILSLLAFAFTAIATTPLQLRLISFASSILPLWIVHIVANVLVSGLFIYFTDQEYDIVSRWLDWILSMTLSLAMCTAAGPIADFASWQGMSVRHSDVQDMRTMAGDLFMSWKMLYGCALIPTILLILGLHFLVADAVRMQYQATAHWKQMKEKDLTFTEREQELSANGRTTTLPEDSINQSMKE